MQKKKLEKMKTSPSKEGIVSLLLYFLIGLYVMIGFGKDYLQACSSSLYNFVIVNTMIDKERIIENAIRERGAHHVKEK